MSESNQRAPQRERPLLTDPPFLCSSCRHGSVLVQKLQPWLLGKESWQEVGSRWYWRVHCRSAKISPWKFTIFSHPIVECDAYRMRKILTTEDLARKEAKKAERARKRRDKRKKRKRKKRKKRSGRK